MTPDILAFKFRIINYFAKFFQEKFLSLVMSERKRDAVKQKQEAWDGTLGHCEMDG